MLNKQPFFFALIVFSVIACRRDVPPVSPKAMPTAEPVVVSCTSSDECLQESNEARQSMDSTKQLAVLEYGCAEFPTDIFCVRLAQFYLDTPPADAKREREILASSCTNVSSDVCARLSVMAYKGYGGDIDKDLAVSSAKIGCSEAGESSKALLRGEACFIVGSTTFGKDKNVLASYFERGCRLGYEANCPEASSLRSALEKEEADKKAIEKQ
jgi:hypothetical protein